MKNLNIAANGEEMMHLIADLIDEVLKDPENDQVIAKVRAKVNETMKDYPLFICSENMETQIHLCFQSSSKAKNLSLMLKVLCI